jgi:hypothetical protein
MRLFILVGPMIIAGFSLAHAQKSTPPPEHSVSGIIQFEPEAHSGGELYLTVTPAGSEAIKVEKSDAKKRDKKKADQLPEATSNQFLNLGGNNGKPANFSVKLKPGRYRLGCLVKTSEPPCSSYRVNNGAAVTTCLPGKKDILCAEQNIEIENTSIQNLVLKVGLPVK